MSLPESYLCLQFPESHATVQFKREKTALGYERLSLEVMCIDAYSYQREFYVSYGHTPGDSSKREWTMTVYQHPWRRASQSPSPFVAKAFIERFLYLCQEYPSLLWGSIGDGPRAAGFVHLCESLHRGAKLTKGML